MNAKNAFEVKFGGPSWTIEYLDPSGTYTFVFEADIAEYDEKGTTKRLLLSKGPPLKDMEIWKCLTQADREAVALMLERVKQYLSSLGYEVDIVD